MLFFILLQVFYSNKKKTRCRRMVYRFSLFFLQSFNFFSILKITFRIDLFPIYRPTLIKYIFNSTFLYTHNLIYWIDTLLNWLNLLTLFLHWFSPLNLGTFLFYFIFFTFFYYFFLLNKSTDMYQYHHYFNIQSIHSYILLLGTISV